MNVAAADNKPQHCSVLVSSIDKGLRNRDGSNQ